MSLFYFLLLAEAAKRNTQHVASLKKPQKKSYDHIDYPSSRSSYNSPRTPQSLASSRRNSYSFSDLDKCVLGYVAENEKICAILDKIYNGAKDISQGEMAALDKQLLALSEQGVALSQKYSTLTDELNKRGMHVDVDDYERELWHTEPKSQDKRGFSYYTIKPSKKINGVTIKREDIASGKDPYKERLDDFAGQNYDEQTRLNEAQAEYDRIYSHSIRLKVSQKERNRLANAEQRLRVQKEIHGTLESYKDDCQTFEKLGDEGRQLILDYLDCIKELETLHKTVYQLREDVLFREGYGGSEAKYGQYKISLIEKAKATLTPEELHELEEFISNCAKQIASASTEEIDSKIDLYDSQLDDKFTSAHRYVVSDISDKVKKNLAEQLEAGNEPAQKE